MFAAEIDLSLSMILVLLGLLGVLLVGAAIFVYLATQSNKDKNE
jgi:hypothetical protein